MYDTVETIVTRLAAGMTTDLSPDAADYYVKTWYRGDPLAVNSLDLPACAVIPGQPTSRISQYVGMDTESETVLLRFYTPAARKAEEDTTTAQGVTRLQSMIDKAQALLRADPTFGSTFVNTEIRGVIPLLPGVADANAFRVGEITVEIKRRVLWGA